MVGERAGITALDWERRPCALERELPRLNGHLLQRVVAGEEERVPTGARGDVRGTRHDAPLAPIEAVDAQHRVHEVVQDPRVSARAHSPDLLADAPKANAHRVPAEPSRVHRPCYYVPSLVDPVPKHRRFAVPVTGRHPETQAVRLDGLD